jgi:ABC-type transport system involved in multi-copper enzyme maturation permease subunit
MSSLVMPLDVMWFELRRSLTFGRVAMWLMLIAFPVAIIAVLTSLVKRESVAPDIVIQTLGFTVYFLVPEVTCLLGLLLWATPAISTETEGQTWIFLVLRQSGRRMVLLGKYLTAVVWTFSAALVAIVCCMIVIGNEAGFRMWWVMATLALLSCIAHAALYILIGVIFYRRTMAAAVLYTVIVEYGVSFVPALINKFTINYRLRGLLANWMGWDDVRSEAENVFGSEPSWTHLLVLAAITLTLLGVAMYRVERTEYPTQQEG